MAAAKLTGMRCIGCRTETREGDEVCRKCGDRVAPRARWAWPPGAPTRIQEHVDRITGHPRAQVVRDPSMSPTPSNPTESSRSVAHVTLTGEQADAIARIGDWYAAAGIAGPGHTFRLFGPAGTGKTTLARSVGPALGLDNVVFGAYTGKAAHVLRKKGVPATTIHSAVYKPVDNYEVRAEWRRLTDQRDELVDNYEGAPPKDQMDQIEAEIERLEATMHRPSFEWNRYSEWADADLIVLDEVSMVNRNMAHDIERFGVPVLVLGDPEQLPPIEGGGYYTSATPDALLTEVHRQALESPVYALATQIREGRGWSPVPVSLAAAMEADQIICWKNSTRWNLITKIREKLGRPAGVPVPGDRIMCLVNNKDAGILNGQQFEVLQVLTDGHALAIKVRDDGDQERLVYAYPDGFLGYEREKAGRDTLRAFRGERGLFTFANVVTCHKAQGSEWDHVYVVDQTHQMWRSSEAEKRRWCYTATSRASERVTIARAGA